MSAPTPRTDEQINGKPCTRFCVLAGDSLRDALVQSDFARTLERELNESRNAERLARVQLGAEREKVRTLREALQNLLEEQNDAPLETRRDQWQMTIHEARAALAATEEAK